MFDPVTSTVVAGVGGKYLKDKVDLNLSPGSDQAIAAIMQGTEKGIGAIKEYAGKAEPAIESAFGLGAEQLGLGRERGLSDLDKYFSQAESAYDPYVKTGLSASNAIADITGVNGPEAQAKAYERYKTDPFFKMMTDSNQEEFERSGLQRGNLFSGNFATEMLDRKEDLMSKEFGNYYARLLGVADTGFGATQRKADVLTRHGAGRADIDVGTGRSFADLYSGKGSTLANMYTGMGSNIASLYGAEGKMLADINLKKGEDRMNFYSDLIGGAAQLGGAALLG